MPDGLTYLTLLGRRMKGLESWGWKNQTRRRTLCQERWTETEDEAAACDVRDRHGKQKKILWKRGDERG